MVSARVEQVLSPNHFRQPQPELPHRKTNQKDGFWNRGHEMCQTPGSPGDLSSYKSSLNAASRVTLQEKLQKL